MPKPELVKWLDKCAKPVLLAVRKGSIPCIEVQDLILTVRRLAAPAGRAHKPAGWLPVAAYWQHVLSAQAPVLLFLSYGCPHALPCKTVHSGTRSDSAPAPAEGPAGDTRRVPPLQVAEVSPDYAVAGMVIELLQGESLEAHLVGLRCLYAVLVQGSGTGPCTGAATRSDDGRWAVL
jgi:hypothetical protein